MPTLLLLRHGESVWNAKNLFTGWVDVALSEKGVEEAKRGGTLLAESQISPDVVHTSLLLAIVFGNVRDPGARVTRLKQDPRGYRILEDLNVRPAITYLAKVVLPAEG